MKTEGKLVPSSASSSVSKSDKKSDASELPSVCNMNSDYKSKLPSFWLPSLTPESKTRVPMKKPVSITNENFIILKIIMKGIFFLLPVNFLKYMCSFYKQQLFFNLGNFLKDTTIYCPMSNSPLTMKDLTEVKFKKIEDKNDTRALIVKQDRYVCAVSNDVLGNNVPCCVLRTSGQVVTQECVEKIIKKDMIDPTCSKKLSERDIIPIQRVKFSIFSFFEI